MTIYDLADVMNVKVIWTRNPGSGSCVCEMENVKMKDRGGTVVCRGVGKTPYEAMNEYVNNIKGKRLVRTGDSNQEFAAPENLESIAR